MSGPSYKKYYPCYDFGWFKEDVDSCYCDGWFTYDGVDYRIQFQDGEIVIVEDDDKFVPVFRSGTTSLEEFWEMPVFGFKNFEELFPHIQVYDAQY